MLFAGIAYLIRKRPFLQKIGGTIAGIVAYALLSAAGVMLSFSAAITCMPLQDALMTDLDKLLGYDWRTYGEFVKSSVFLTDLFAFSYFSIDWQPIIIVAVLAFRNKQIRILSYIVSTMLALVLTMAIFSVAPVTTAWTDGTPADISDAIRLSMNDSWVGELKRLRDGQLRTISWGIIGAVVGFPSFHCIAALVNSWHLWRDPGFRLVGLPLNVSLIASSLVLGGHYMVDLIAALFVAMASIFLAQSLVGTFLDWPRPLRRQTKAESSGAIIAVPIPTAAGGTSNRVGSGSVELTPHG